MTTHTISIYVGDETSALSQAFKAYCALGGKTEAQILKSSITRICKRMKLINKDGTLNKREVAKVYKVARKAPPKKKRAVKKNPVGRPRKPNPIGRPKMKRPVGRPRKKK